MNDSAVNATRRDYAALSEQAGNVRQKNIEAKMANDLVREGSFEDKANLRRDVEGTYKQKLAEGERDFGRQWALGGQRESGAMERVQVGEQGAMSRAKLGERGSTRRLMISEAGAERRTGMQLDSAKTLAEYGKTTPQAGFYPSKGPYGEDLTYNLLGAGGAPGGVNPANSLATTSQMDWAAKLDPKNTEHRKLVMERYMSLPSNERPAFLTAMAAKNEQFIMGLTDDLRAARNNVGGPAQPTAVAGANAAPSGAPPGGQTTWEAQATQQQQAGPQVGVVERMAGWNPFPSGSGYYESNMRGGGSALPRSGAEQLQIRDARRRSTQAPAYDPGQVNPALQGNTLEERNNPRNF
jgi:hypothetical protein